MARPYSMDWRERVVRAVTAGASRRATAAKYDVSPSFVIKLMQRWRRRGTVQPDRIGGRAGSHDRRAAHPAGGGRHRGEPVGGRPVPCRLWPDAKKRLSTPPSRTAPMSPPRVAPGASSSRP